MSSNQQREITRKGEISTEYSILFGNLLFIGFLTLLISESGFSDQGINGNSTQIPKLSDSMASCLNSNVANNIPVIGFAINTVVSVFSCAGTFMFTMFSVSKVEVLLAIQYPILGVFLFASGFSTIYIFVKLIRG